MEDFEVFAENVKNQILEFLPEEYQSRRTSPIFSGYFPSLQALTKAVPLLIQNLV